MMVVNVRAIITVNFYFERSQENGTYKLQYYDVTLQKENGLTFLPVDGINPAELEKQMANIDWKKAFNLDERKVLNPDDKSTWETELKISGIIESLSILEISEAGKVAASSLKHKFWAGTLNQEIIGPITPFKNKADVSQRFYFSEDGLGITVDEAYRFLQNKCLEKQALLKKKQAENIDEVDGEQDGESRNSGLLKKKRIVAKGKRNKINQG